jgi:hypothetical protein
MYHFSLLAWLPSSLVGEIDGRKGRFPSQFANRVVGEDAFTNAKVGIISAQAEVEKKRRFQRAKSDFSAEV